MLRYRLTHPEIIGAAGHDSTVLLADGNYPHATAVGPNARNVNLNLRPGQVPVLRHPRNGARCRTRGVGFVMLPDTGPEPQVFARFRQLLGQVAPRGGGGQRPSQGHTHGRGQGAGR